MNRQYRIAFGFTVVIFGLLLLSPFNVTKCQELTEAQRQERCQNNRNRKADLEKQVAQINKQLATTWSDEKIARARTQLQAIRRIRGDVATLRDPYMERRTAIFSILREHGLTEEWNTCRRNNLNTSDIYGIDAKQACLTELESTLGKRIDKAEESGSRRSELEKQKADLERQIHKHDVNLLALRCDEKAVAGFAGTWLFRGYQGAVCTVELVGGNKLRLVTERNEVGHGYFADSTTIIVDFPFGRVTGQLSSDGTRINWSNREFWLRVNR